MMEREKYNCPVEAALSQFGGGEIQGYHPLSSHQGRGDALQ